MVYDLSSCLKKCTQHPCVAVTFQPQIEDMGRCTLYSEITNPIGVGNENVFIQAYVRIGKC